MPSLFEQATAGGEDRRTPFGRLSDLFYERFYYNDLISSHDDPQLAAANLMAMLVFPGMLCFSWVPKYYVWLARASPQTIALSVFGDRLLWMTFSMSLIGLIATLQWDRLFPDRRDYMILGPQPVSMRVLFGAQARALARFLATFFLFLNLGSALFFPLAAVPWKASLLEGAHFTLAYWLSLAAAAAFVVLGIMAVQGTLANLLTPRMFERVSPLAQALLAAGFLSGAVMAPVLRGYAVAEAASITDIGVANAWTWRFPPMAFAALGEWLTGRGVIIFAPHAGVAALALTAAAAVAVTAYLASYRRFLKRSLESAERAWGEIPVVARLRARLLRRALPDASQRAAFLFTLRTLLRSPMHRLYLSGFVAVGAATGFVQLLTVESFEAPAPLVAAQPYLLLFVALAGMRVVFAIPAEWAANWVFRFHSQPKLQHYLAGARKAMWSAGPLPLGLATTVFVAAMWGGKAATIHLGVFTLASWISVEISMAGFWKIPFTCRYLAGRAHVIILWTFCAVGMLSYSAALGFSEVRTIEQPWRLVAFAAATAAAWAIWRPIRNLLAERSGGPVFEEPGDGIVEIGIGR